MFTPQVPTALIKVKTSSKKPTILVLALEKPKWWQETETQLSAALHKNAVVQAAYTPNEALQHLLNKPPPSAILALDAAPALPRYKSLLRRLIEYAHKGGRVVLGGQFANDIERPKIEPFFKKWDLPWSFGSYFRSTFTLNPAGIPTVLDASKLFPVYSMNTISLKGARMDEAIYALTSESFLETPIHPPLRFTTEDIGNSPVVLGRVGKGYLGFAGDVNCEQETTHALLAMCNVDWTPGELGERQISVGVMLNNGKPETMREKVLEMKVPLHFRAGGAREAEVAARRVKRYTQARVQQAAGDRLKEQVRKNLLQILLIDVDVLDAKRVINTSATTSGLRLQSAIVQL